jgi:hypothetical protein
MDSKDASRELLYFNSSKGNTICGPYFTTTITRPITRIKQTEILSAVVPFTFYNINDGNCLIGYYNDPGGDVPIYVSSSTLFATTAALLADFNTPFNHTTTLSIVNGKFVLASQTAITVTVTASLPGSLILGFNTTQVGLSVTAPVSTTANIPFYFHPANNLKQIIPLKNGAREQIRKAENKIEIVEQINVGRFIQKNVWKIIQIIVICLATI